MLKEMYFPKGVNVQLPSRSVIEACGTGSAEPEGATQVPGTTLFACDIQATGSVFYFPWS